MYLVFFLVSICFGSFCWAAPTPLRILTDRSPDTLNPRNALDSQGQRIGSLLYRALTRINENLIAQPDLAESFYSENGNRKWTFILGQSIAPEKLIKCIENYRVGTPRARITGGFYGWVQTKLESHPKPKLIFELTEPDPYFPKNVSLLRYFETKSAPLLPCSEPSSLGDLEFSGKMKVSKFSDTELLLTSNFDTKDKDLHFLFIPDETARTLALIQGKGDVAQNTLSLTKTRWAKKTQKQKINVIERNGTSVSYLAFNLTDPVLKVLKVRQAITKALPIQKFIDGKMMGLASKADHLISPELPEYTKITQIEFKPEKAQKLLDEAGFPVKENGFRFHLNYRTTPIREGIELAKWIQYELNKINIAVDIQIVEPAVFLNSIRKGNFQLFTSRWIGVSDASILYRTLHSNQNLNRWNYQSQHMNSLLTQMMAEPRLEERKRIIQKINQQASEDLPFLPLFFWKNSILTHSTWKGLNPEKISLSGSYDPLLLLNHE